MSLTECVCVGWGRQGKFLPSFAATLSWPSSHYSHEVTEYWKGATLNRDVPSTHCSSEDSDQKKKSKKITFFFSF